MAIELVEYRPGRWVKVVDGRTVGRASPEEVAAWQREAGHSQTPPTSLVLDVDLGPDPLRAAEPSRVLEVPLRPAFERRGRAVRSEPAAPADGQTQPGGKPATAPAPAPAHRGASPAGPRTLEFSLPVGARIRPRPEPPAPKAASEPPLAQAVAKPALVEVTPLPRTETGPRAKPPVSPALSKPTPPAAATQVPPRSATEAAAQEAPPAEAIEAGVAEQPGAEADFAYGSRIQGPSYWWVYNAQRQPVAAFLKEWGAKYATKFGHPATLVLCHEQDLGAAQASGLEADTSPLLQPGHFYLGHGNGEEKGNGRKPRPGSK